ncbi:MAG: prephenate dehydrogenase/arogenate dehydrogenase family protein [Acidobacteria bacterium]|nr:prephenate dehydrogenase/arogenate dehydrogenase family protein [Acidobacteriota bacterium]
MPIRQITIVGTGLIGGSLGLALRRHGFTGKIIGCDRAPVLRKARQRHAIDHGVSDPLAACRGSDLVVLATPIGGIIALIERLAPSLDPETLVTDVGSTKLEILKCAQRAFGDDTPRRFLPGHPLAGKENSGIEFADPNLFRQAVWFFTPAGGDTRNRRAAEFISWVKKLEARVAVLEAAEHDELCAWISHVPQMVATAMAATLVGEYGENARLLESGGRALREMTRIAASPYSMWRDIALTNKKQIRAALLRLEQELEHIRENLDTRTLEQEFVQAHRFSSPLSKSRRSRALKGRQKQVR